jgi:hypothetical protein
MSLRDRLGTCSIFLLAACACTPTVPTAPSAYDVIVSDAGTVDPCATIKAVCAARLIAEPDGAALCPPCDAGTKPEDDHVPQKP